jgi:hypothetical protein
MSRSLLAVLSVLTLVPACTLDAGDEFLKDTLSEGSAGSSEDDDIAPSSILECELEMPCDAPFEGMKLAGDGTAGFTAADSCVFRALAAGDRALVQTSAEFSDDLAYLDYAIVGEGAALRQAWGVSDAGGRWEKEAHWCDLRPASFFEACAEQPVGDCLDPEQWVVRCVPLDNLACPG